MTDEIPEDEPFAPFERWFALASQSELLAETMTRISNEESVSSLFTD